MDAGTIFVLVMTAVFFLFIAYLASVSRKNHQDLENLHQRMDRDNQDARKRRDAA
jgi:hypothetical protein